MDCSFGNIKSNCSVLFSGKNYDYTYDLNISFEGSTNYNGKVKFPVNFNGAINLENCFSGCTNYNRKVTIPSHVTSCKNMFFEATKFNKTVVLPEDSSYFRLGALGEMFANSGFNRNITIPSNYNMGIFQRMFGLSSNTSLNYYSSNYKSTVTMECTKEQLNYYCETLSPTVLKFGGVVIYGDDCMWAGSIASNNSDVTGIGLYPCEYTEGATIVFKDYNNAKIQIQNGRWECLKRGSLPVTSGYRGLY